MYCEFYISECGNQNNHDGRVDLLRLVQPIDTFAAAANILLEVHVEQHDIVVLILQQIRDSLGIPFGVDVSSIFF